MSEEREKKYLESLSVEERIAIDTPESTLPPYGVIVNTCVIRDLGGVGFEHLGSKGQEIIKSVVALASDNYPELMRKCYMINTPWVFNTVWYFVKGLLAAKTIAKVSVMGSAFQEELAKEIRPENIPKIIGGPYVGYQEYIPFAFDLDYLCRGCGEVAVTEVEEKALDGAEGVVEAVPIEGSGGGATESVKSVEVVEGEATPTTSGDTN
eukprot:gene29847-36968_t